MKCEHPASTVSADILEGDHTSGVQWCRICGAYRRFTYHSAGGHPFNFGPWRAPEGFNEKLAQLQKDFELSKDHRRFQHELKGHQ